MAVHCLFERVNSISTVLEDSGALAVTILPKPSNRAVVEALFDVNFDLLGVMENQMAPFGDTDAQFRVVQTELADRDWVVESQRSLTPVQVTDRVRIAAPWHAPSDAGKLTVLINPGVSFGTGHHETTLMCAKFLATLKLEGATVVDYGCGSGVLAILALKLGAKLAWGVDIDPDALADSEDNAARNGVQSAYRAVLPDKLPADLTADVVIANLFADALVDLADRLMPLVRSGGWLVLSGILDSQVQQIETRYANDFELSFQNAGQWVAIAGRRID